MRVSFDKTTGFSNNPAGQYQVAKFINDGFYNSFTIIHNAGSGSFLTGRVSIYYQSYSHAYVAGQIAGIKDALGCSWWEARHRARVTATENNIYDTYDGYGKINVDQAINSDITIPIDPYDTLGTTTSIEIVKNKYFFEFTLGAVAGSLKYVLYDNSTPLETVYRTVVGDNDVSVMENITRQPKSTGGIRKYYYLAYRGEEIVSSDTVTVKWFLFPRIYTKNN